MKYILFCLLICCCIQLNAQNVIPLSIEDKKMDSYLMGRKLPTLTIQLKNLPDSVKRVGIQYSLVQLGGEFQTTRYAETDKNGIAKITLDKNFPYQQIWLKVAGYLYAGVYVNSDLTVTIDVDKLPKKGAYMISDGIVYSGIDGELNMVMNKHTLYKQKERNALFNHLRKVSNLRRKNSQSFSITVDSIRTQLTRLDNEFIEGHKNYAWAIRNETLSEVYSNLCYSYRFDIMPAILFKEVSNHQPFFTSNEGVSFYRALSSYSETMGDKERTLNDVLAVFDSLYSQQKSDILKLTLLEGEKDLFSKSYSTIINNIKIKWGKKLASAELERANNNQKRIDSLFALSTKIENSAIGKSIVQLPFKAELYHLDEIKNVEDFLRNLKLKFPNKALILDFWATWCAPCLADLPSSKKLHEANKDLSVEYIYLCTSSRSSLDIWKNKVADLEISGTHIFVDDKIITQLKSILNAKGGFPSYVVIDMNGKINPKIISRMEYLNRESLKTAVGL